MATWVINEKFRYVWITIFYLVIVLFNLLNVRRYGEIEYWLTVIKLATIVGIIILGLLLPLGISPDTRQLGTTVNDTVTLCTSDPNGCLGNPGFECSPRSPFD